MNKIGDRMEDEMVKIENYKEEWQGKIELSDEEEKFVYAEVEDIPIARFGSHRFLSLLKDRKPDVIFIVNNGGFIEDIGGSGQFEVWFIDKDENRKVETYFCYDYGYLSLSYSSSKFILTDRARFLESLLMDIFRKRENYSIYRIKTLKINGLPLDFSWRIPWYLIDIGGEK